MSQQWDAVKGSWVQISQTILEPDQRAPQVPEDTKKVPLMLHVNGFLNDDNANIGDTVSITTVIGRTMTGQLIAVDPVYGHIYGKPPAGFPHIAQVLHRQVSNDE